MVLGELFSVNIKTGKITVMKNVKPSDYPSLWFSAKRVRDKKLIIMIVTFCINWANKLYLNQRNKYIKLYQPLKHLFKVSHLS